ncbi:MAG: microsomal dipeptidase-like Zn-dependent dipeptidase [Paracoccaceae bacterium]|jgi:membrane dipeptidase
MALWTKIALGTGALAGAGLAAFLTFGPGIVEAGRNVVIPHAPWPVSAEAKALHDRLVIGDWHADPLMWNRDLTKRADYGQVDLPRLIEGNVAVQVFTAVTKSPAGQNYEANSADATDNITLLAMGQMWPPRTWDSRFERALYQAQKLRGFEAEAPDMLKIIRTKGDLAALLARRAGGDKIVGGVLGIEGMHALDGDLDNIGPLFDAGYRLFGLTHFFDNAVAGSLHGQSNAGLTDLGREVVKQAIARNVIIDLAHSSPKTAREVLALDDRPLVVSHGGTHGHCPVKRNFADDLMQAIAAKGGVIGIGYWQDAVCGTSPTGIVDAIAAAVDLLGEDHVSLGSDFDGSVETGFDTSELAALTEAMLAIGWSEDRIAKVMGGNMMRVLAQVLPD